jgi:hypothetical protein
MHPLAHHLGEDSLVNLLLLGGGGFSLMAAAGRTRLAATRAKLTRKQGSRRRRPDVASEPQVTARSAPRRP